jgi:hypothetical protein
MDRYLKNQTFSQFLISTNILQFIIIKQVIHIFPAGTGIVISSLQKYQMAHED